MTRNDEIKSLYNQGKRIFDIASLYGLSLERITQIINDDNQDLRNKIGCKISKKEKEILELISYGYSDKEIALKLNNSPRTIQTHVTRICIKLEAQNRTHATCTAIRNGAIL